MKAKELREKSVADLKKELLELTKEQFNLRMQKSLGEAPKPHHHAKVRHSIARVKTIMREKEGKV
jgi:large subunit ribosomal protein L29